MKRLLFEDGDERRLAQGQRASSSRTVWTVGVYTAHAPVTVNVAGPWVDRVLSGAGSSGADEAPAGEDGDGQMIGGTKGSHIVVDPFPGAPSDALYVEARRDGRPYFIVPWNGRYLIGTTDFRYKDDLDYVSADDDEIDYLIDETNAVIPEANLSREDVLFTYSGVRPLPFKPEGSESSITRGPRRLRPRHGQVRRRRQAHRRGRWPQGRRPDLHRRRQAHHLPQPRPPDGGRRLQEARPAGPAEPHGQGSPSRRRHAGLRRVRRGLQGD